MAQLDELMETMRFIHTEMDLNHKLKHLTSYIGSRVYRFGDEIITQIFFLEALSMRDDEEDFVLQFVENKIPYKKKHDSGMVLVYNIDTKKAERILRIRRPEKY